MPDFSDDAKLVAAASLAGGLLARSDAYAPGGKVGPDAAITMLQALLLKIEAVKPVMGQPPP